MAKKIDYNKRNKVYKLLNATKMMEDVDKACNDTVQLNKKRFSEQVKDSKLGLPKDVIKEMEDNYDKLASVVVKANDYGELFDLFAELYYDKFTEEELDKLIEFYSSGIGQTWVRVQNEIAPQIGMLTAKWNEKAIESIIKLLDGGEEELGDSDEGIDL